MFAKLARRAPGVAAAATAVATAGASTAQARAPPSVAAGGVTNNHRVNQLKLEDEWVQVGQFNGNQVLFQPYNEELINEAVDEMASLLIRPAGPSAGRTSAASSVQIAELSADGTDSTDGEHVNSVIERADDDDASSMASQHLPYVSPAEKQQEQQLTVLLQMTKKMLRRPGLQREVVLCMMEDPEVRDLMLMQSDNLDAYLIAVGIPPSQGLLPPGELGIGTGEDSAQGTAAAGGPTLIDSVIGAVSSLLQRTGGALAFLGGWLRDRFSPVAGADACAEGAADKADGSAGPAGAPRKGVDTVLGGVMVVAVAIICMLVVKRPMRVRFA